MSEESKQEEIKLSSAPAPIEHYASLLLRRTIGMTRQNNNNPSLVDLTLDNGTVVTAFIHSIRSPRKVAIAEKAKDAQAIADNNTAKVNESLGIENPWPV